MSKAGAAGLLALLARLPSWLAALALFALMLMTFADVILRSAFDRPIEAATELTRIAMSVVVFASLPVISARGQHISVDLLDRLFRGWGLRLRDALLDLACGLMLIWPVERCLVLAGRARDYGDVTEYLGIPQMYPSYFIALAAALTSLVLIVRGALRLFAPRLLPAAAGAAATAD